MDKELLYILQAAGVVIASLLTYLVRGGIIFRIKEKKAMQAVSLWEKGIEDMRLIRNEHLFLREHHALPRSAFFIAHNGGSAPSKETDFYCSVKDETGVTAEGDPLGFKMEYDYGTPIKVDFSYAQMIEEAYSKGYVHYKNVDDMPDCLLKRIYKSEKVAESIVVFYSLDLRNFRFGYASHARYESDEPFTDEQVNAILISGNRLRTKFGTQLTGK